MANVFVTLRRRESDDAAFDMYIVKDHAGHFLGLFRTEQDAVNWSKDMGHLPLVVRSGISGEKPRTRR